METSHKQREIFAITTTNELGTTTREPEKTRKIATRFDIKLWNYRQDTKVHSRRRTIQMLRKRKKNQARKVT